MRETPKGLSYTDLGRFAEPLSSQDVRMSEACGIRTRRMRYSVRGRFVASCPDCLQMTEEVESMRFFNLSVMPEGIRTAQVLAPRLERHAPRIGTASYGLQFHPLIGCKMYWPVQESCRRNSPTT